MTKVEVLAGVAVLGVGGWFLVASLGRSGVERDRQACLANLTEIGRGIDAYLREHDNRWPFVAKLRSAKLHNPPWPTLPEVMAPYLGDDRAEVFHCPADSRRLTEDDPLAKTFSRSTTYFATEGLSYEWYWGEVYGGHRVGHEAMSSAKGFGFSRADQILLSDFEPFHRGEGGGAMNTL